MMFRGKNAEKLVQDLVWYARDVNFNHAKKDPDAIKPVEGERVNNDVNEGEQWDHLLLIPSSPTPLVAVEYHRTLLALVLTNCEARKLISDLSFICPNLLATDVSRAATNTVPSRSASAMVNYHSPDWPFGV
jgi:hypothetical protein